MKKSYKKFFATIEVGFVCSLIVMGFLLVGFGVSMFYTGFHNLDLSYNIGIMMEIVRDRGVMIHYDDFEDVYNVEGGTISYGQAYSLGVDQMKFGFILSFLGFLVFGFGISHVMFVMNKDIQRKYGDKEWTPGSASP